ncbi:hypothetical protein mRhiFer1_008884 [Rhinolophus ferrumequinum]|uniref:Formiminotransferase N-terminal subdomain domain-containing protein n=1 Tax=Rhinolophus ferrumequinum TaxID=59479 RepID=A0A7J8AEY4_RHIFE|nr:hypothetical protein mRhiFer1_008884 [Rhinolophus ferrumequinum]
MSRLVECVPNFSEGNNQEVIEAISQAVVRTPGCVLLDVDAGPSTNRTVYTFVGRPEDVVDGALNAARAAFRLIDMRKHKGEHPRMGALDVCPFIPVRGVSMDECVLCAQAFGQRLAEELGVPVYLYGEAAQMASRRTLPAIRAGEYEALPEKVPCPLPPRAGLGVPAGVGALLLPPNPAGHPLHAGHCPMVSVPTAQAGRVGARLWPQLLRPQLGGHSHGGPEVPHHF